MDAVILKKRILEQLTRSSRFDTHRKYLGMSRIGECPARLYRECMNGRRHEAGEDAARRAERGYMYEENAIRRLTAAGLYKPGSVKELIADFDERVRGHTDGELTDGDLLEIKSCYSQTFEEIQQTRRAPQFHLDQVQLYLRYGGYKHGVLLYICTETFRHYAIDVYPSVNHQERLIARAKMILAAIDAGEPPVCTCGRCFGFRQAAEGDIHATAS